MSYIETKANGKGKYLSFVKKVRFMQQEFLIKKHIGKTNISKKKYLLDNLDNLSEMEFAFRKIFLNKIKNKLSYSENLPEKIELKSIKINNLIEAKECEEIINNEFAKEFIFNSNNIEGSKIPRNEVERIIETGDSKYENKNEIKEVKNSIAAFEYILRNFRFNLDSVKRLYYILVEGMTMEGGMSYPKGFKDVPNVVNNHSTTAPEKVKEELQELLDWYKKNWKKEHPIILALEFHKRYEMIHPFLDGNGRTGRLLMNKILISGGYFPIVVYKENKESYFNSLAKSAEGMNKKYYQFMLEQTDKTYDFVFEKLKKY